MAKLKPSQIRGTVSDWKIIVKQDDSTFREAGPSDFPTVAAQVQADWNETDINEPSFIENKPIITQSDWAEADPLEISFIENKPNVVTTIWTPGSDDNLVTEKAVRDAIVSSSSSQLSLLYSNIFSLTSWTTSPVITELASASFATVLADATASFDWNIWGEGVWCQVILVKWDTIYIKYSSETVTIKRNNDNTITYSNGYGSSGAFKLKAYW